MKNARAMRNIVGVLSAFAAALSCASTAAARPPYAHLAPFEMGEGGYEQVIADLNGDALLDLALTDIDSNAVIVLWNRDTYFEVGPSLATELHPTGLCAVDFDQDGDVDLLAANHGSNQQPGTSVTLLVNEGDDDFVPAVISNVGSRPRALAAGDVDGDGDPDVLVANDASADIRLLINTGGGLVLGDALDVSPGPVDLALVELTGDAVLDLAVASRIDATVTVYAGNGDGTFTAAGAFPTGFIPSDLAAVDLDGDGAVDLALPCLLDDAVTVLINDGAGVFTPAPAAAVGPWPSSLAVADVNEDGAPDLLTANAGTVDEPGSTVSLLYGVGDGTFAPADPIESVTGLWSVAAADIDADGHPDLAVADVYGFVQLHFGAGDGGFVEPVSLTVPDEVYWPYVVDVNGDGHIDLLFPVRYVASLAVMLGDGEGNLAEATLYGDGIRTYDSTIGDFDLDGDIDAALTHFNTSDPSEPEYVYTYLNDGAGAFELSQVLSSDDGSSQILNGDVDGDGYPELLVRQYREDRVVIFRNLGDGTFVQHAIFTTCGDSRCGPLNDYDGDGDLDLIYACESGLYASQLVVRRNDGSGNFDEEVVTVTPRGLSTGPVGDLDGDGDLDIVVRLIGEIWTYFNDGDGSFQEGQFLYGDAYTYPMQAVDLDEDGALDVLVQVRQRLLYFHNEGDGMLEPHYRLAYGNVRVADFNEDGWLDLLGGGNEGMSILFGRDPLTGCVGDLDGDGDTDQSDLGLLLAAYDVDAGGDLDGDGDTDQGDLGLLLADYECGT